MTVPAAQGSDSEFVQRLRDARARIERGWCQGEYAIDRAGQQTPMDGPNAVAWCISGAFGCLVGSAEAEVRFGTLVKRNYTAWNDEDGRTKAEVLALFDRAIALAEGNAPLAAPSAIPSPAPPETP